MTRKKQPTRFIEDFEVKKLKPHKNNQYLYQDFPDDDLLGSIERSGIKTPLVIDGKTKVIISGHRRWAAAKKLGLTHVSIVAHYGLFEDEILMMLVDLNHQRERTVEMKMREAALVKSAESKRRARLKKEANADGKEPPEFEGTTSQVAASKTGLSTAQVDRSVTVVKEMDKAEEAGDAGRLTKLKGAASKSIGAASEAAKPAPKKKKAARVDPYNVDHASLTTLLKSALGKLNGAKADLEKATRVSGGPGVYSTGSLKPLVKIIEVTEAWQRDLK